MPARPNTVHTTIIELQDAITLNLPNLDHGKLYSLQQLAGAVYWHSLPIGTRKGLGQPFKALAIGGGLPVRWDHRKSNNTNVYQLK